MRIPKILFQLNALWLDAQELLQSYIISRVSFYIDLKQLFVNAVESNNFEILRILRKTDMA